MSSSKECRVSKEVQIDTGGDRADRLDVCAKSNSNILVLEAKKTFDATIHGAGDNDYRISIPKYRTECQKIMDKYDEEYNTNTKLDFLLGFQMVISSWLLRVERSSWYLRLSTARDLLIADNYFKCYCIIDAH